MSATEEYLKTINLPLKSPLNTITMHYANENQLSALKELGFTPTEDKTTLTEVAQWLWEKYRIDIGYSRGLLGVDVDIWVDLGKLPFLLIAENRLPTIPEALSWAIDQAIKYLQEQK